MTIELSSQQWGGVAALSAATCWALATVLFKGLGRRIPPLQLNLLKGIIASTLIVLVLLLGGSSESSCSLESVAYLALSGVIGIAIGDSAYFAALSHIGARKTLITESTAPPITAFIAFFFLGEALSFRACMGIALTVLGVLWVVAERAPKSQAQPDDSAVLLKGFALALLAAFCQATGAVLSRAGLLSSSISPLWSALLRLLAAVLALSIWIFLLKRVRLRDFLSLLDSSLARRLLFSVFVGTFLAIWLQQISFKLNNAGVAQTLLATSPIFVLPMAPFIGEKVSLRAFLGAILAVGGIAQLFGLTL